MKLPRRSDAGLAARQAVETVAGTLEAALLGDLRLLVTELIANRVRPSGPAAASWLELEVAVDDQRVRVELRDFGPRWVFEPSPFTFEPEHSSGWGLYLVDRLADHWGLERRESWTRIWFELVR